MPRKRNRKGNGIVDRWYDSNDNRTPLYGSRLRYRAHCHFAGRRHYTRCFPTLREAEAWKLDQEEQNRNRDNPGYFKRKQLEKAGDVFGRDVILKGIEELKGRLDRDEKEISDIPVLHAFADTDLMKNSIAALSGRKDLFIRYFKDRQQSTYKRQGWKHAKPVTARAVARERNIIQRIFQQAIDENWFEACGSMENPVRAIRIEGSMYKKTRTLLPGEEEKLIQHFEECQGLNKYYVPLATYISLDTSLRLQEVAGLRWIAVGTRITARPPHRTVRARLRHTAPTLDE